MYPRNAAAPERIAVGAVVLISDGTVQTATVLVKVMPQGGAAATGGGTIAYEEGIVHYTPTQAETNHASFVVLAYKAACIPVSMTVVTTASATAGTVLLAPVTHTSAVIPTVSAVTGNVGGSVASVVGAVGSVTGLTVANLDAAVSTRMATFAQPTGFLAATFPGTVASPTNITAAVVTLAAVTHTGAVIPTVSTVTGFTPANVATIMAKTDQLTFSASMLQANMMKINGTTLVGNGVTPKFGV